MPTLSLLHRTAYRYSAPVQLLPHRLQLRGRELRLLTHDIVCSPAAGLTRSRDVFGNAAATALVRRKMFSLASGSCSAIPTGMGWSVR